MVKKIFLPIFLLLFLIICFMFGSCSSSISQEFDGDIMGESNVKVTVGENVFNCILNINDKNITVTLNAGNYKGLSYIFSKDGYEINYNNLICKSDISYICSDSFITLFGETFEHILSNKKYIGLSVYNPILSDICGSGQYKITFNPDNGKILSAEFINTDIKAEFLYD